MKTHDAVVVCLGLRDSFTSTLGRVAIASNSPVTTDQTVTIVALIEKGIDQVDGLLLSLGDNSTDISLKDAQTVTEIPEWATTSIALDATGMNLFINEHNFPSAGTYEVSITASNAVGSYKVASSEVYVQTVLCLPPTVEVTGGGISNLESITYKRSRSVRLQAKVTLSCDAVGRAAFQWTIHKMEPGVLQPSAGNMVGLPSDVDRTGSTLTLPCHTLDYGLYLTQVKVSIS